MIFRCLSSLDSSWMDRNNHLETRQLLGRILGLIDGVEALKSNSGSCSACQWNLSLCVVADERVRTRNMYIRALALRVVAGWGSAARFRSKDSGMEVSCEAGGGAECGTGEA